LAIDSDGKKVLNKSKVALTSSGKEMDLTVKNMDSTETGCSLLANLLVSSGSGKVRHYKIL
jgi:hypothetical protein